MEPKDPPAETPRDGRRVARPLDRAMQRFDKEPTSARQGMIAIIVAIAVAGWGLNSIRYPMLAGVLFVAIGMAGAVERLSADEQPREPTPSWSLP